MPFKLNTVLFAYSSPTLHHGSPRVLVDIITGIDKVKYSPIFVCPENGPLTESLSQNGIEVIVSKWRSITKSNGFQFCRDIFSFWKLIGKRNIKLLHMNEIGWRDSLLVAAWLRRIPVVLHLHVNFNGPIESNWNFRIAAKIIVVAQALKPSFALTPNIYNKLVTIHNALEIHPFQHAKCIRDKLNLPVNCRVVGYVGQLVKAKGLEVLIVAAKEVLKEFPETIFLFVGRTVKAEEEFPGEIIKYARENGFEKSILFLKPRNDIPDVMKSIDMLVLPTFAEAFPKVILEAMGAGLPIIASEVGGIPEIIDSYENGILVQPGNSDELSKAILKLLKDEKLCEKLANGGVETVRHHFSIHAQVDKIEELYNGLICE